uniref:Uncharacterized protein n=1 Tax=Romanomermis culicivorax TaxID=13658 RepID=A0A915HK40_ROMCU
MKWKNWPILYFRSLRRPKKWAVRKKMTPKKRTPNLLHSIRPSKNTKKL